MFKLKGFFCIFGLNVKGEVTRCGKSEMTWEAELHHFVIVGFSSPFSSWCMLVFFESIT